MAQLDQGGNFADILAICQRINSERDLGALLDLIAREAIKLVDCDRASIFLLDRERNELWSKVALGSDEILRFDASSGIAGAAVTSGSIVNVLDAYSDPRFYTGIDSKTGYRTRTVLVAPLRNQSGKIIGAFEVLNKHAGVFNRGDEECPADARLARSDRHRNRATHWRIAPQPGRTGGAEHALVARSGRPGFEPWDYRFERARAARSPIDRAHPRQPGQRADHGRERHRQGNGGARRTLHQPARAQPFVALNCAALPETLIESELFGIEKGVATGVNQRIGQFEKANGGTLFLDEIGDLSMTAQAKILRALQERTVERVGGRGPVPVDVRLLAATNKDLDAEIAKGNFREDLYYRIKVIHIQMPPLRDVREDVPLLARHFLKEYCAEMGREAMEFSPAILRKLTSSPWPGNVRQLRNEVMRLAACAQGNLITEDDLFEDDFVAGPAPPQPPPGVKPQSLKKAIADLERQMIQETLTSTRNNQQQQPGCLA